MNTYRALSPAAVAAFADGVFEHDFTPAEEKDWLDSGLVELVPRTYRVLSNNYSAAGQGEKFEGALLKEIEAGLISGGHIERVDEPPVKSSDESADTPPAKNVSK
jgi:uncharacterized lipoprotein YddW (UPF0748 family)